MEDIQELRARLAKEETALTRTREEIEAARHRIEELRDSSRALERRVALLREYIETVEKTPETDPAEEPRVPASSEAGSEPPSPMSSESVETDLPQLSADIGNGSGSPPTAEATEVGSEGSPARPPSFDEEVDRQRLSHELLPRTSNFEEACLLLLAHHRKALKAADIARAFRRLDYTPNIPTSVDTIGMQLESRPQFFDRVGDRFALTEEGREEADRLLVQLCG